MKILLINPPAPKNVEMVREGRCMQRKGAWSAVWAPISLAYLGAVLEKENHEVKLYDCIVDQINFDALKKIISDYKPSLIICNTSTPSIESNLSVSKITRDIIPKAKIGFIRIHVTAMDSECLKGMSDNDFIIRGEPEVTAAPFRRV